ncbi:hypothetical protein NUH88_02605 [Nisaea acidiphila]|uniref:Jacalin-type lectin domain-containing protein n=1 Tax=Nisaea acidiphila TaxID=1862145 RepID=A0A9J7ATG5_9PROT|nr:hypothetical protein [Nisaea acidiphila]UUX50591.1 hypothetical protein NUH88_02605 [Nisaea acidiphila]
MRDQEGSPVDSVMDQPTNDIALEMFQGFDSIENTSRNTAAVGSIFTGGATSEASFQICRSLEEIEHSLNVHGRLDAQKFFGSFSARMGLIDKFNITRFSTSLIIHSFHHTSHFAKSVKVPIEHLPSGNSFTLNDFFQYYGDSYVKETQLGHEYIAIYHFDSVDKSQQTSIESELKGNHSGLTGSIDASLALNIQNAIKKSEVRVNCHQILRGINQQLPPYRPDKIIEFALKVPYLPASKTDSVCIDFSTESYIHAINVPSGEFKCLEYSVQASDSVSKKLESKNNLLKEIQYIESIYNTYHYYHDDLLKTRKNIIKDDISKLEKFLSEIKDDPTTEHKLPIMKSRQFGFPHLNKEISKYNMGGTHASRSTFNDYSDIKNFVENRTTISGFSGQGDNVIRYLFTKYKDANGIEYEKTHGSKEGPGFPWLQINDDVFVKEIKVTRGDYVNSIKLTLSDGTNEKIPKDPESADSAVWEASTSNTHQFFLAFSGSSGSRINQVDLVVLRLRPASWS